MDALLTRLQSHLQSGDLPKQYADIFTQFYQSYDKALHRAGESIDAYTPYFNTFLDLVIKNCADPYVFEPYHTAIRKPFDYYRFGLDLLRPLIDLQASTILHEDNLKKIENQLALRENVILLANHQTETDPQIISLLLEKRHPRLAEEMIFVAGERVLCDPMAIPFSMGRHLLCIYSRKYIDHPPEQKSKKQLHNQKTMKLMKQLLTEGGKCIYVAPSGGRDRIGEDGIVQVAPFDPDSVEMFRLMAQHSGTPTHFYPMALATYDVLPPPSHLHKGLGEKRTTKRTCVHLALSDECKLELTETLKNMDKTSRRRYLSDSIYQKVVEDYRRLTTRF